MVVALMIISLTSSQAQDDKFIGVSYSMASPSNGMSNYMSNASFTGGNIEYRQFLNNNLSVGFNFGMNTFNQGNGYKTYHGEQGAISGEEFRDFASLSTYATVHYYFGEKGGIRPYVGMGIGASGQYFDNQIGGVLVTDQYWSFSIAPEVGVLAPLGDSGISLLSNVKYQYAAPNSGYQGMGMWSFNIGIAIGI